MLSKSLSFNFLSKRSSVIFRGFSDSITYSGGQASAGQGNYEQLLISVEIVVTA